MTIDSATLQFARPFQPVPFPAHLKPRQRLILEAIRDFTRECGYAPSYRELADMCELPMASLTYQLGRLREMRLIDYADGIARSVRLTP